MLVAYADLFRATSKSRFVNELGTALYRGLASPLERTRSAVVDIFHALPLQPKISASRDGTPSVEFGPLALPEDLDRTPDPAPQVQSASRKYDGPGGVDLGCRVHDAQVDVVTITKRQARHARRVELEDA